MVTKGEFLDYLRFEKNRSMLTVESYAEDLKAFEAYFKSLDITLSWETVDSDVIRDWMESMMDKGNKASSVNRRLSAVRSFYRYALARHRVQKDPSRMITGPKKEKPLPQFVKEDEMNRLLDDVEWGDDFESIRARTVLMTFYETGIRLSELTGLNDTAIDWNNHAVKVLGKRNKQRIVPMGEELEHTLFKYISARDSQTLAEDGALFVTTKGKRMTAAQVRREVQQNLSRVCTLRKRSPHVLRHTFATAMLNHKAGLESVKNLLGHESLSTTEIYTHTTFEQLKRVYQESHPRE